MDHVSNLFKNHHRLWTLHAGVIQSQPPTFSTKRGGEETRRFNSLHSIHTIHRAYSYSYSDDDLFLIHNILGKELVIQLYNDDVFRRENFLNKVIVCHRLM